jgi:hypothetical protein
MTSLVQDDNGQLMPVVRFGASQVLAYTGTSAQSTAFSAFPNVIRIVATSDCHVLISDNPTATTTSTFLPAGMVEYVGCKGGNKIAAIQKTGGTAGSLFITECA